MSAPTDPLASLSFTPLDPSNPNVLIYRSASPSSASSQNEPKVIILATWLGGASVSRISVYCRGYQSLFPTSVILLLRTVLSDITIKTFSAVQKQLQPAQDYLLSTFAKGTLTGQVAEDSALLHVFSHGGCNTALQLSRLLRQNNPGGGFPVPLAGVILDSCPGSTSFSQAYAGAAYSLPPIQVPGLTTLARASLFVAVGAISTLQSSGLLSSVDDLRRELNEPETFGPCPRLYLHSKGDTVVLTQDVASHAAEIGKVVPVWREVWEVAEHCALPVEDAARYWDAIQRFVSSKKRNMEARL